MPIDKRTNLGVRIRRILTKKVEDMEKREVPTKEDLEALHDIAKTLHVLNSKIAAANRRGSARPHDPSEQADLAELEAAAITPAPQPGPRGPRN